MTLYLGRHGQDEDNAAGLLNGRRNRMLTDRGREQACELGEAIRDAGLTFKAVYCSPLLRAHETAIIICRALDLPPPIPLDDLIEKDYGTMAGKRICDIPTLCALDILETEHNLAGTPLTYFLGAYGGEDYPAALERAARVLAEIQSKHDKDDDALIISHGCIGKMIFSDFYQKDWQWCLTSFHFGNSELLRLSPDCDPMDAHFFRQEQHNH